MNTSVPNSAHEHKDILTHYSFGTLIWKVSKTYSDMKFCKEAKTIIVVEIWLNSLSNEEGPCLIIDVDCLTLVDPNFSSESVAKKIACIKSSTWPAFFILKIQT